MPRYLVTTRRALRGSVPSAAEALKAEPGVRLVNAEDPDLVTMEATAAAADRLRAKLRDTHFVEPEIRRSLE